ncbi:MAG: bifunctional phosphopantothenoylcysteine decarboxylase/phosphopantothenate--cysteine ligase CoaBC [Rhodocyclaceae bacterium]|jgi:phosphopantothenoylcysteine decarboxylase/phosphopantothenate--cysteine ligase|nr:bifunctional phosphopantothenoylcysteine decarboxylase/phosphopantothenate--cysteine ligase CoaBC [Rhodocyclaceae bacterium]MBK6906723.1 bifunctional phosphopantothenoylcysteine decarboxylase/phosphopantothenate--cysteine ligase CoaBC [Rhodocyclaceae bacterium]
MRELRDHRFVLGVTGGVAAYKAAELVRLMVKAEAEVDVVLTDSGSQFVGAATFQALTGRPVWRQLWDERMSNGMAHIDLTRGASGILVVPATADFLAKLVHGAADDLLSTLCLARHCPLHVAPAMNRQMWENPATQRNVAQLGEDGISVWGPDDGDQACGETGAGRMLEPSDLFQALVASVQLKVLAGHRVILTAGPTFEALDPVRGLTNSSSGKMGFALARACADAGATDVVLVAGPTGLATPYGVKRVDVKSAVEMRNAVLSELDKGDAATTVFIGVAAVADYRPRTLSEHKIKKGNDVVHIELEANPDILAEVASLPDRPFCVGFAAESQNLAVYAEGKRVAKRLQLVVGNLVRDGLGGDTNVVSLFDSDGEHPLGPADKLTVSRQIVAHIARILR